MHKLFKNTSIRNSILYPTFIIIMLTTFITSTILFFSFQDTTSQIVQDSSKEINKQVILNFENYIDSVIDTADYIQEKTIENGLRNNNVNLPDVYSQAADVQPDIESIVLIDRSGNLVVSSTQKDISNEDLTTKEWFIDAVSDDSIYHFSSPHPQDIFRASTAEVITVTKVVDYYHNSNEYQGILIVDINTSNIINLTETTNLGEEGHIIIINDDGTLIYSNKSTCINDECESLSIAKDIIFGGRSVSIEGTDFYANVNTLQDTRWRMATFINTDILTSTRNNTALLIVIVLFTTLTFTVILTSRIASQISSPINKLKSHMERIEKEEFYETIEIDGQKEVLSLTHSFNEMIKETKDLMERILFEQRSKRKTEFQALQNQINPHFLYNTLDSIVYLSENKMNEKVVEMVVALSKFFRISISRGKNIILLKEELEHARNYLLIQQIRYHEKFDFQFDVDEEVLNHEVVKLTLQPLIENAIQHGINTEYKKGKIIIRAYLSDNNLVLEVEDDGYGLLPEQVEELYETVKHNSNNKSVGLKNVYQRLLLYYGEGTDFIIESELDVKTIIRLVIPRGGN